MSPLVWVAFVAAGALGAPLRYILDTVISNRTEGIFPWGTLVINASGSLLLGLLTGLSLYHAFPNTPKVVLGAGFAGAYTTFSTFTFETVALIEDGAIGTAFRNALATLVIGAAAAAAGLLLAAI
jgi:CrcB protein